MEPVEVRRRLRKLGAEIEALGCNPNWGGCCIIAAIVCGELERLGVRCEVATPEYGGTAAEARRNNAPPEAYVSRCHLCVRFRMGRCTYTWDSAGLRRDRRMPAYPCRAHRFGLGMCADEAEELYYSSEWNNSFDTDAIPEIEELAQAILH